jgi:hypothetical protein
MRTKEVIYWPNFVTTKKGEEEEDEELLKCIIINLIYFNLSVQFK